MVIALVTDFGTRDHFVGAMKGVIYGINPNAAVADITHEVEPQQVRSAAFLLAACWRDFPEGTVFLCVVDPGVGSSRRAIVVESRGKTWVGPDNGLFTFALNEDENAGVFEITNRKFLREDPSSTFHGRDIFAPAAAHISLGVPPKEFGPRVNDPVLLPTPAASKAGDGVYGEVVHIDHFGNVITNITAELLPPRFHIEFHDARVTRHVDFYAQAAREELVSVMGSAGFLEIVVNLGSAQKRLNAKVGDRVRLVVEG